MLPRLGFFLVNLSARRKAAEEIIANVVSGLYFDNYYNYDATHPENTKHSTLGAALGIGDPVPVATQHVTSSANLTQPVATHLTQPEKSAYGVTVLPLTPKRGHVYNGVGCLGEMVAFGGSFRQVTHMRQVCIVYLLQVRAQAMD